MAFITDCDSIAPIPMMGQIDIQCWKTLHFILKAVQILRDASPSRTSGYLRI